MAAALLAVGEGAAAGVEKALALDV